MKKKILALVLGIFTLCMAAAFVGCSGGGADLQESYYAVNGSISIVLDLYSDNTYSLHGIIRPASEDGSAYFKVDAIVEGSYEVTSDNLDDLGIESGKKVKLAATDRAVFTAWASFFNIADDYADMNGVWSDELDEAQAQQLFGQFGIGEEGIELSLSAVDYSIVDISALSLSNFETYSAVLNFGA